MGELGCMSRLFDRGKAWVYEVARGVYVTAFFSSMVYLCVTGRRRAGRQVGSSQPAWSRIEVCRNG